MALEFNARSSVFTGRGRRRAADTAQDRVNDAEGTVTEP